MKWLVSFLVSTAFAFVVPLARAQSVTLTTPDDPVGDVVDTTEGTLGGVTKPGSVGDSTGGLGDTSRDVVDSGTASAGTSPGKEFRTRFDRLPPRLERLLERIELGRHVRANLRQLTQALPALPVRERARLLHFLNAEIRRLRAGGVSPTERRRIKRLVRTRAALTAIRVHTPMSAGTPTSANAEAAIGTSETPLAPGTGARVGNGGVLQEFVSASKAPPREEATPPKGGGVGPSNEGAEGALPLTEVLLALGGVLLAIVVGLAIREERGA